MRLLVDVHYGQFISFRQMVFAKVFNVLNGSQRAWREAGHEQTQVVGLAGQGPEFFTGFRIRVGAPVGHEAPPGRRSSPTSVRSTLERSPIILRTGSGNLRTKVGIAIIWSPRASLGSLSKSIISI